MSGGRARDPACGGAQHTAGPRAWLAGAGPRAPDVGPCVPVASRFASGSLGFLVRQVVASQGARNNQALSASLPGSKGVGMGKSASPAAPEQGLQAGSGSSGSTPFTFWSAPSGCRRRAGSGLCQASLETPSPPHIWEGAPWPPQILRKCPVPHPQPGPPQGSPAGCLAPLVQGGGALGPASSPGPTPQLFFHLELPRGGWQPSRGARVSRQRVREELSFSRSVHREKWMVQVGTHCRLTWGAQPNRPRLSVSSVKWGHLSLAGGPMQRP